MHASTHAHCGKDRALIRHSEGPRTHNRLLISASELNTFPTQSSSSCVSWPVHSSSATCYHSLPPGSLCNNNTDLLAASGMCHACSPFGSLYGLFSWPRVTALSSVCLVSPSVTAPSLRLCSGHPPLPPALRLLVFFVCCCDC